MRDTGPESGQCAGAVAFEGEDVFEGVEDRLDPLADGGEVEAVVGLVLAGGSEHGSSQLADRPLELLAGVALVADDRLAASEGAGEQLAGDFSFGPVCGLEGERPWCAVGGEGAVQAHAPEEAGVGAAVAVAAGVGQLRPAGGLERAAYGDEAPKPQGGGDATCKARAPSCAPDTRVVCASWATLSIAWRSTPLACDS